jgi:hypothetical protein
MEFLWVRWFGTEIGHQYGFKIACLPKVGFVEENDPSAFGFLNPSLMLWGCHLIPSFVNGRTSALLKKTRTAAHSPGVFDDWATFYVNMYDLEYFESFHVSNLYSSFVDRDMFMHFLRGGVGHQTTQQQGIGTEIKEDGDNEDGEEKGEDKGEDEGDDEVKDKDEGDGEDNDSDLGPEDGEDFEEMEDEYCNL